MTTIPTNKIWTLAWPMILSNISVPLLGLVDTAVLGHLDSADFLAAVALGSAIIAFIYWGFGFLRMGTTGVTAVAFGADDGIKTTLILLRGAILALAIALLIGLLHPVLFDLGLWAMNSSDTLTPLADQYLNIRLFGAPAALLNYVFIGWFVGIQRPKLALLVVVLCNINNILLDLVFVVGYGLTSDGVAWATVIAEYLACSVAVVIALKHKGTTFDISLLRQALHATELLSLLRGNSYLFVRTVALLATMAYFTKRGAEFGVVTLAANALLMQLAMLVSYGLDGFANAAEALVGEAIGQRQRSALHKAMRGTAIASLVVAMVFCLALWLCEPWLILLLTDQMAIIDHAHRFYPYVVIFPAIAVWSFWLDGVFIGANRHAAMMWSMLFSSIGVFAALLFALESQGNDGLWLAYLGFIAARGISLGFISYRYTKTGAWFKTS